MTDWDKNERKAAEQNKAAYHCFLCGCLAFSIDISYQLTLSDAAYRELLRRQRGTHFTHYCRSDTAHKARQQSLAELKQ